MSRAELRKKIVVELGGSISSSIICCTAEANTFTAVLASTLVAAAYISHKGSVPFKELVHICHNSKIESFIVMASLEAQKWVSIDQEVKTFTITELGRENITACLEEMYGSTDRKETMEEYTKRMIHEGELLVETYRKAMEEAA